LINENDICYHHLGEAPPKQLFYFKILMIDIFGDYKPISTKISEISVFFDKISVFFDNFDKKMIKYITPSWGSPIPNILIKAISLAIMNRF